MNRPLALTEPLYRYLVDNSLRESALLAELRTATQSVTASWARMQISPDQGQFMGLLAQAIGACHCVEVGTFTGYSALVLALALPANGRIVCCDTSVEWTAIARTFWRRAGVDGKIDLRIAPALQTLDQLVAEGEAERFDFAFIDADKVNYPVYYERCLSLVRPGGVLAIDNTLWSGRVADPADQSPPTRALREFNSSLHRDDRVTIAMVPVGDGMTIALKR